MQLVLLLAIIAGMFLAPALHAQSAGIPTETTRRMNEVSKMGEPKLKPAAESRSLSFEEGDDPTVAAHSVPPHEPLKAAHKAADKAEHLAKKNRHAEAVEIYREAVAADPLYYEAWNNLALELDAAGQSDEAAATFRRLIQSSPEHVLGFTNLATMLSKQHHYVEAEAVVRQAVKLHAYSFKANYTLGLVLVDQGKWNEEAKAKLEYAQLRYPDAKTLLAKWPK